jgi:hypothetical protein
MLRHEIAQRYRDYLTSQGFAADYDADGDVRFTYEGGTYLIIVDEDDDEFFRVVYPNFWAIESEPEREKVYEASNIATERTKVVKVFVVKNNVWASVEMFQSSREHFHEVFRRSLSAIRTAVHHFVDKMRE